MSDPLSLRYSPVITPLFCASTIIINYRKNYNVQSCGSRTIFPTIFLLYACSFFILCLQHLLFFYTLFAALAPFYTLPAAPALFHSLPATLAPFYTLPVAPALFHSLFAALALFYTLPVAPALFHSLPTALAPFYTLPAALALFTLCPQFTNCPQCVKIVTAWLNGYYINALSKAYTSLVSNMA